MKFNSAKPLIFIIILLVITNAILLFLLISGSNSKSSSKDNSGMYFVLKDSVGFTNEQLAQYQTLRETQFKKMKPLFQKVNNSKEQFYKLALSPVANDSIIHSKADSIGYHQKNADLQMFRYFVQLRNLCTPEQLAKFDSNYPIVIRKMIGKRKRNKS